MNNDRIINFCATYDYGFILCRIFPRTKKQMNTNLTEILKSIPDFEDFLSLADEIGELSFKKMKLENIIKGKEAQVVTLVSIDSGYFVNGKPPSMAYIEATYRYTGVDGKLLEERNKLADITAMLEKRKLQLSVYKDMLDVWRTLSANSRSTSI